MVAGSGTEEVVGYTAPLALVSDTPGGRTNVHSGSTVISLLRIPDSKLVSELILTCSPNWMGPISKGRVMINSVVAEPEGKTKPLEIPLDGALTPTHLISPLPLCYQNC